MRSLRAFSVFLAMGGLFLLGCGQGGLQPPLTLSYSALTAVYTLGSSHCSK